MRQIEERRALVLPLFELSGKHQTIRDPSNFGSLRRPLITAAFFRDSMIIDPERSPCEIDLKQLCSQI
jgi:hypothetical protein